MQIGREGFRNRGKEKRAIFEPFPVFAALFLSHAIENSIDSAKRRVFCSNKNLRGLFRVSQELDLVFLRTPLMIDFAPNTENRWAANFPQIPSCLFEMGMISEVASRNGPDVRQQVEYFLTFFAFCDSFESFLSSFGTPSGLLTSISAIDLVNSALECPNRVTELRNEGKKRREGKKHL